MSLALARPGCSRCGPTSQPHGSACQRASARYDHMGTQGAAFKSDHTWHSIPCARTSTRRAREAQRQKLTQRRGEIPEASPAGARCVLFNLFPRHQLVPRLATYEDGFSTLACRFSRNYAFPGPSDPEPLLAEGAFAVTPLLVSLVLASPFSSRSAWCQNSAS